MRRPLVLVPVLLLAACGGGPTLGTPPTPTPTPTPIEDLEMSLEDFANIPSFTQPAGRSYFVTNLLGHQSEALIIAGSATGGTFPVGSVVRLQASEVMVKRRRGFNATTNDWEFFGIAFGPDGTPQRFTVRGAQETGCFQCHQNVSSRQWDFICAHP